MTCGAKSPHNKHTTNNSNYRPKVHNMLKMLKVAIHENRWINMMDATSTCKIDMKWHETWVIAQVCIIT